MPTPSTCRHCQRAMRPGSAATDGYPDTVAHAARGLCRTCYERARHQTAQMAGRGESSTAEHNAHALTKYLARRSARIAAAEARQTRRGQIDWAA